MEFKLWFACLALVLLGFPAAAKAGIYTIIDVPASLCGIGDNPCYAAPTGINAQGTVVGFYEDANQVTHGFYRTADGTFTGFDYPGECLQDVCSTEASVINDSGKIAGNFFNGSAHEGFLLNLADGHFTTITVPGGFDVVPTAINSAGVVVGGFSYLSAPGADYAFVLQPGGALTTFKGPGQSSAAPSAINSQGEIAGEFESTQNGVLYGAFLRSPEGHSTTQLNLPGSENVTLRALDDGGQAYGTYYLHGAEKGYILDRAGNYTVFTVPGAEEFYIYAANDTGTAIGVYSLYSAAYGFYRLKDGTLGYLDPPGSAANYPVAINSSGEIAGIFSAYDDAGHYLEYGYVRSSD